MSPFAPGEVDGEVGRRVHQQDSAPVRVDILEDPVGSELGGERLRHGCRETPACQVQPGRFDAVVAGQDVRHSVGVMVEVRVQDWVPDLNGRREGTILERGVVQAAAESRRRNPVQTTKAVRR